MFVFFHPSDWAAGNGTSKQLFFYVKLPLSDSCRRITRLQCALLRWWRAVSWTRRRRRPHPATSLRPKIAIWPRSCATLSRSMPSLLVSSAPEGSLGGMGYYSLFHCVASAVDCLSVEFLWKFNKHDQSQILSLICNWVQFIWNQTWKKDAPLGSTMTLDCNLESSPSALHFWSREGVTVLHNATKYISIQIGPQLVGKKIELISIFVPWKNFFVFHYQDFSRKFCVHPSSPCHVSVLFVWSEIT